MMVLKVLENYLQWEDNQVINFTQEKIQEKYFKWVVIKR